MSQEQIIFENVCCNLLGEYRSCPYKSLGNVILYLKAYGLMQYDTVQVGDGKVTLWGKLIATFTFDENKQLPVFSFFDFPDGTMNFEWIAETQNIYLEGLSKFENPYKKYLNN